MPEPRRRSPPTGLEKQALLRLARMTPENRQREAQAIAARRGLAFPKVQQRAVGLDADECQSVTDPEVWMPSGLPMAAARALSVPWSDAPMNPAVYPTLLQDKLTKLMQAASPKEAQAMMEMSPQSANDLYVIGLQNPRKDWPGQIVQCQPVALLLKKMADQGWKGRLVEDEPTSFRAVLEEIA